MSRSSGVMGAFVDTFWFCLGRFLEELVELIGSNGLTLLSVGGSGGSPRMTGLVIPNPCSTSPVA